MSLCGSAFAPGFWWPTVRDPVCGFDSRPVLFERFTMPNCNTCVHRQPYDVLQDPSRVHSDCGHKAVSGQMGCQHCKQFHLLELWGLELEKGEPAKIRCPADGCRHVQSQPGIFDWRVAYVGTAKRGSEFPAPDWCPGYEQGEPDQQPVKKPGKKLSRKARRQLMPSLFD